MRKPKYMFGLEGVMIFLSDIQTLGEVFYGSKDTYC